MSSTEIAVVAPHGALAISPDQPDWTPVQRATFAQMGIENASEADCMVFLNQAQRTGLDPFTKQIYMIGRKSKVYGGGSVMKWTIQAAIDGLRVIAQRSGKYTGQLGPLWCGTDGVWVDVWLGAGAPAAAKVGVLRKGFTEPMWGVARYASYVALKDEYIDGKKTKNRIPSGQWPTMPDVMLAKCAEAQALRRAFPQDLSGIYTAEEMDQADAQNEVVEGEVVETQALPAAPVIPDGSVSRNDAYAILAGALGHELAVKVYTDAGHINELAVEMTVVDDLVAGGRQILADRTQEAADAAASVPDSAPQNDDEGLGDYDPDVMTRAAAQGMVIAAAGGAGHGKAAQEAWIAAELSMGDDTVLRATVDNVVTALTAARTSEAAAVAAPEQAPAEPAQDVEAQEAEAQDEDGTPDNPVPDELVTLKAGQNMVVAAAGGADHVVAARAAWVAAGLSLDDDTVSRPAVDQVVADVAAARAAEVAAAAAAAAVASAAVSALALPDWLTSDFAPGAP